MIMSSQNNYREFFELYTKLFVSLGGKNQCKFPGTPYIMFDQ